MNSPAHDIVDILAGVSSLALTNGTDLFTNSEPASPNDCVTVYDTNHPAMLVTMNPDTDKKLENLSVQVRVRDAKSDEAWVMVNDIKNELHGKIRETINGAIYHAIWHASGPFPLERDDKNRTIYTMNFELTREEA
jgi:hypothetical protein